MFAMFPFHYSNPRSLKRLNGSPSFEPISHDLILKSHHHHFLANVIPQVLGNYPSLDLRSRNSQFSHVADREP